jgi:hypothetical protein
MLKMGGLQLAAMNNVLIPAGIVVNVLIWNREADILRLSIGAGIILAALLLNQINTKASVDKILPAGSS